MARGLAISDDICLIMYRQQELLFFYSQAYSLSGVVQTMATFTSAGSRGDK